MVAINTFSNASPRKPFPATQHYRPSDYDIDKEHTISYHTTETHTQSQPDNKYLRIDKASLQRIITQVKQAKHPAFIMHVRFWKCQCDLNHGNRIEPSDAVRGTPLATCYRDVMPQCRTLEESDERGHLKGCARRHCWEAVTEHFDKWAKARADAVTDGGFNYTKFYFGVDTQETRTLGESAETLWSWHTNRCRGIIGSIKKFRDDSLRRHRLRELIGHPQEVNAGGKWVW